MGVSTQRSLNMRLIWTSLALVLASLWHVQGYTCPPGKSKKTINLGVGESVDFSTQDADSYGKNVKCVVKFKKAKKAKCELNFSCSAFTLTAKNSNCNRGSDFLKIGKEKFCEDNSPDVTVAGRTLNVLFRSNKRSKGGEGAECEATCVDPGDETPTTVAPPATTPPPTPVTTAAPTTGGVTSGPGVTVPNVPNPGSDGGTFEITIVQSWSQETNYARVTQVQVPPTTAGQKVPMVIDLHGNGGQGNLRRLSYLADGAVIVAPNGYERSWNVNNEKSKADDVSFILELIARVAEDHPAADANNVNLIGTSNGAAIIYRLLIATGIDRPFHRVFPMVSSMISVQWRDGSFWKSPDTLSNDYTIQTVPEFSDDFEYYHFHGTNDGTIAYEGKCPGPPFLGTNVCVVPAQQTDFLFAQAMGYTGSQIPDSDGVEIGEDFVEYSYLDGRVKHFKDIGGTHGSTFGNANTKAVLEEVILGHSM